MEIKAQLKKPYTEKQKISFIVENNHRFGYKIQETEEALLAIYNEPLLPTYKEQKQARANAYKNVVDPLMSEYSRKKVFNLFEEGEEEVLLAKIETKVAKIKEDFPYPEQKSTEIEENVEKDTEAIEEKTTIL